MIRNVMSAYKHYHAYSHRLRDLPCICWCSAQILWRLFTTQSRILRLVVLYAAYVVFVVANAMTTTEDICEKTLQSFDAFTKNCENYLSVNEETAQCIRSYLKALYDTTKRSEEVNGVPQDETLPELIVNNFDEEQIWQELELQNEARLERLVGDVARVVAHKDSFSIGQDENSEQGEEIEENVSANIDNDTQSSSSNESQNDEPSDHEEDIYSEETSEEEDGVDFKGRKKPNEKSVSVKDNRTRSRKTIKPSIVDDKFFKLSQMEEFLKNQEQGSNLTDDSSDESVDMFKDVSSSDSDENNDQREHYSDFFDAPEGDENLAKENVVSEDSDSKEADNESNTYESDDSPKKTNEHVKKKMQLKLNSSDEDEDNEDSLSDLSVPDNDKIKSSFEKRQEKLKKKIEELEAEALSEKPWQLKGEVSAENRPQDGLLEEALEFDATTRPAPVMTEETTKRLEDIIKQRIKDRVWDDVVRKEKPVETVTEFKKKLVLDQEKSKLSLAQVYEQEYLKKVSTAEPEAAEGPEKIPKEHIEINALVNSLFHKLDALSNFHYTPKQVNPEVKIVTNTPAISMEEVAPLATSEATLLAPEEVKAKPHGDVISAAERTDTDKKRERRKKKQKQRFIARETEKREAAVAKLNPGLGNKYSKEKALKLLDRVSKDKNVSLMADSSLNKATKSSSAFFSQLQDEVSSSIKEKVQVKKRQKPDAKQFSVKRLKL